MPKVRTRQTHNSLWLRQRELGIKFPLGHSDSFHKSLYSSIKPVTHWDSTDPGSGAVHGAVFNLDFSPDGSLLLAACEKKSVLMFDPLCRKLIHSIPNAHNNCVNCVRFLDERMFASCSDDKTVALWDARNMKQRIRTLHGHSNWVKNIEYSPSDGLLLTSGFDGSIFAWDINSFTENSFVYTRVFHTNGLMRMRLTPDASKMLICTTSGYLIIIHNLQLSTLSGDLHGFKPNVFRLMQTSQTTIPVGEGHTKLFSHSRTHNRVEFVTDFPVNNDAEVVSSLQVHPQGWCALSRNVSIGEKSEWTCVHDIQERSPSETEDQQKETESALIEVSLDDLEDNQWGNNTQATLRVQERARENVARMFGQGRIQQNSSSSSTSSTSNPGQNSSRRNRTYRSLLVSAHIPRSELSDDDDDDEEVAGGAVLGAAPRLDLRPFSSHSVELHVSSTDVWEAIVALREARSSRERDRVEIRTSNEAAAAAAAAAAIEAAQSTNDGLVSVSLPGASHTVVIVGDRIRAPAPSRNVSHKVYAIPRNHEIPQNVTRLTHYIEEPNVGSGYIKELCFSADGRLICSPFGHGVRLLAFSPECQELSDCVPAKETSVPLHELASNYSHPDIVVCTQFSPKHFLLVSGCLAGRIVWHQPVV